MAAVLTAAQTFDTALAAFNAAISGYMSAVTTTHSAYRTAHGLRGKASLENPEERVRFAVGQNALTATVLGVVLQHEAGKTLASLHVGD